MNNTVKTSKSDEMLKSLAAHVASQGLAIFLQQKQEYWNMETVDFETIDDLRTRLEDMESNNHVLEEEIVALTEERDRFKSWWQQAIRETNDLQKLLKKLEEQEASNG